MLIKLIADGTLIPIVLIGIYALVAKVPAGNKYAAYSRVLMAGLTALLVAKLMANVYQPETLRPFELLGVPPGAAFLPNPGFPSDHALLATAITLAVWFETKSKPLTITLLILLVLLGVGRVLALVHTPVDIIGGVVAACVGGLWYLNEKPLSKSSKRSK